ncbi:hypothetical protein, partial [Mesorhizobium sp. M7A.F.Ca.ET.027.02.1.1]|uniref:hypothetical protein n=1 Tax=Mesorhizobium sp. M7A.F.Ca.ET.027.02.1.1 TaxID=2496655 RepID=UPI001AECD91E
MFMRGTLADVMMRFNAGASKNRGRRDGSLSAIADADGDSRALAVYTRRRVVLIRTETKHPLQGGAAPVRKSRTSWPGKPRTAVRPSV